jgi:hypothetical protein
MHVISIGYHNGGSANHCNVSGPYPNGADRSAIDIFSVDNPQGWPCEATLVFSDQNFLPVTFDIQPVLCLGYQQAEISIPLQAPNGLVTVLW